MPSICEHSLFLHIQWDMEYSVYNFGTYWNGAICTYWTQLYISENLRKLLLLYHIKRGTGRSTEKQQQMSNNHNHINYKTVNKKLIKRTFCFAKIQPLQILTTKLFIYENFSVTVRNWKLTFRQNTICMQNATQKMHYGRV